MRRIQLLNAPMKLSRRILGKLVREDFPFLKDLLSNITYLRINRIADSSSLPLLLNVGCGSRPKLGWLNSDVTCTAEFFLDVNMKWRIAQTLSGIYSEMLIGGLTREELLNFLQNSYNALKPGGVIRISTINYRSLTSIYLDGGSKSLELLERHNKKGYPSEYGIDILFNAFCCHYGYERGRRPLGVFPHDEEVILQAMRLVGFKDIEICDTGFSRVPELSNLESRNSKIERTMNLNIEGHKPN